MGGILAGAGAGALLSGATTGFAGWIAAIGPATVAAVALGLYMMVASLVDWWLPGRKTTLAAVVAEAQQLSGEIAVWIGQQKTHQSEVSRYANYGGLDSHQAWEERSHRSSAQHQESMNRWNERFAVRALAAYDQLLAHGAKDLSEGRHLYEHPTNYLGIERIARDLGVMAAHLHVKKLSRN